MTTRPDTYRQPLPAGNPRRITDAKCAWRKMTPDQRLEFTRWMAEEDLPVGGSTK